MHPNHCSRLGSLRALPCVRNDVIEPKSYVLLPRYRIEGLDVILFGYETGHDSDFCFGCLAGTCVQRVERCQSWDEPHVTHAVWHELS